MGIPPALPGECMSMPAPALTSGSASTSGSTSTSTPAPAIAGGTIAPPGVCVSLSGTGADARRASAAGNDDLYRPARPLDPPPVLRDEARAAIESRLLQQYGQHVDADRTFFNVFGSGHASARSYNGWEHAGPPLLSVSLTDMLLRNFPADLGEDPNGLNANSGLYTAGREGRLFDSSNETRLLSSDLKQAIRSSDFSDAYHRKLSAWWERNLDAVARLAQARTTMWCDAHPLSPPARQMLRQVLEPAEGGPLSRELTAHVFDIDSYPSKDMTWLSDQNGHVVLMMPGSTRAVRDYASIGAMRQDIEKMSATVAGRKELAAHFSLYNRKDGIIYQGIEKWLVDIAGGGYASRIAYAPQRIEGNIFRDQAVRSRDAELDDVKRLVKNNREVIEEESTQFVGVLGQLVPELFLPAKSAELALHLHQAVADGAAGDRRTAANGAVSDGIALATALAVGAVVAPVRRVSGAVQGVAAESFNAPRRLADGRSGYLLGPVEAPRWRDRFVKLDEVEGGAAESDDDIDDIDAAASITSSDATSDAATRASNESLASVASSASFAERGWRPMRGASTDTGAPPSPGLGLAGNASGLPYFNRNGWIECTTLSELYRVEGLETVLLRAPEEHGFAADLEVEQDGAFGSPTMLITLQSRDAAVSHGIARYGSGNFLVFRIDAAGIPAIPYRLNVNYEVWRSTPAVMRAREAGLPSQPDLSLLTSQVHPDAAGVNPLAGNDGPAPVPLSALERLDYENGLVFLDNRALTPDRVHRSP